MGLPIERWAKQATLLDSVPRRVQESDLLDIARYQHQFWHRMGRELRNEPTALESLYGGLLATPPAAQISTTSINGEVGIWSAAVYTPIPANTLMVPETFRIAVTGQCTTVATPGNATWTPRIGTTTGGSALGASNAIAVTASITNSYWHLVGDLTCRTVGPTTTATAIGTFLLHHKFGAAGAGAVDAGGIVIFGNTVATFDSTAAQGLFMGMAMTVTTVTWKVDQIHWMSWN
jgi:hypothetical protein